MLKKITIPLLLALSFNAQAETEKCSLKGRVHLPESFLQTDSQVRIYNLTTKIENGTFCFEEKISMRPDVYMYVIKENEIVLKNKIVKGYDDLQDINLGIEKVVAENTCVDNLCDNRTIQINLRLGKTKEITNNIKDKYYTTFNKNFDYERIEYKIQKQERNITNARKKEFVDIADEVYFELDKDLYSTNYKKFEYKKSDIRNHIEQFKSNQKTLQGLTKKEDIPDIILTHWFRYLYYYGTDFEMVGALYSESLKEELIENKAFDKPLIMTSVYQNNLKNKTKVRGTKDNVFFKRTTKELKNTFGKMDSSIYNLDQDYGNIEFVFENGAWRLNKFDASKKFFKDF